MRAWSELGEMCASRSAQISRSPSSCGCHSAVAAEAIADGAPVGERCSAGEAGGGGERGRELGGLDESESGGGRRRRRRTESVVQPERTK